MRHGSSLLRNMVCIQRPRKYHHVDYDQFVPNFDICLIRPYSVSLPDLKLFGPMKTEVWAKKVGEFSTT